MHADQPSLFFLCLQSGLVVTGGEDGRVCLWSL